MSTKLYVTHLPLSATAEALGTRFCNFGDVLGNSTPERSR